MGGRGDCENKGVNMQKEKRKRENRCLVWVWFGLGLVCLPLTAPLFVPCYGTFKGFLTFPAFPGFSRIENE